jgi:biotin operon repressor
MKLTDVKPTVFESFDEDDSVVDLAKNTDLQQSIRILQKKEQAISHEMTRMRQTGIETDDQIQRYRQLQIARNQIGNRISVAQSLLYSQIRSHSK